MWHFSHSVQLDVSAHFSALDDEEFFVVEGSWWRGRRESDFQVFCSHNSVHALIHVEKHMGQVARQNHHHHHSVAILAQAILAQKQFRSEILLTAVRLWKGSTLFLPCLRWPKVRRALLFLLVFGCRAVPVVNAQFD